MSDEREIGALTPWERHVVLGWLVNATRRLGHGRPEAVGVANWLEDNLSLLGLDKALRSRLKETLKSGIRPKRDERQNGPSRRRRRAGSRMKSGAWGALSEHLDAAKRATADAPPDRLARHLRKLGEYVGLARRDIRILDLLVRHETQPVVEDLADRLLGAAPAWRDFEHLSNWMLPCAVGLNRNEFRRRFEHRSPLVQSGLVRLDERNRVTVAERLYRVVTTNDDADIRRLLLGEARPTELSWSDFDHLGQDRDDVAGILKGALEENATGVNILIHGPPGTGKTAFCHTLTAALGAELFCIGEADEFGQEPDRRERLAELLLAQRLLHGGSGALLLFDEMDDLLGDSGSLSLFARRHSRRSESKVFLNRLLEETSAPTLWITNHAGSIDRAILRRMMFALEVRQPPARVRARVWSRQLERHRIQATADDAAALAREFDAAPGVAAGATVAARLGGGDIEFVRRSVRGLSRVLGCDRPGRREDPAFDRSLIEADFDLASLVDRLAASGELRFSLCLTGPPGTGKSACVRYLAERLGLEIRQERASDLLSMWVGGSEKNIAEAFARARDERAFLIFDEADSLLADRRRAGRRWEISQVNEMLTWMETHPLPFACTTNYGENLDPATLRRFVFKVALGYLGPESAAAAFRLFFQIESPRGLRSLRALTPGDFAVVRRKAETLGQADDPAALLAMLRAECLAKPGASGTIGFGA